MAPTQLPFTQKAGPNISSTCQSQENYFALVFDEQLWQFLVDQTNLYAAQKVNRTWKMVTVDEMKGFVAVILNMGVIQLRCIKDYWSTKHTTDLPFFRSVFSRDRFFEIFRLLHVGDVTSTLKRSKIQPLLDRLCPIFKSLYSLSQHVAIDESMITFKGRVGFRQYLKGKPHPWGIKAFVLADSTSGYVHNMCIYYGKETTLLQPELPHTVRVVLTLMEGLHNMGYDLYVDRFYNSPLLAMELKKIGITVTGMYKSKTSFLTCQ